MAFSESNLNQNENFQRIHLERHCLVTSRAELIGFTKTFLIHFLKINLFLEIMF